MSRNITDLHPTLQEKANELVELCKNNGLIIKITDCYRNEQEQNECVTNGYSKAKFPTSQHNWFIACDFCRNDGVGAFDESGDFFTRVGQLAKSIGLAWGGDWTSFKDKPHLYLPNWGSTTSELRKLYGSPEAFKSTWGGQPQPEPPKQVESTSWMKRLQNAIGTTQDGIPGPKTLAACPLLKKGSNSEVVKLLQERLANHFQIGVQGGCDGKFGSGTNAAVDEFQQQRGLKIDGIVGQNTWRKLLEI